MIDIFSRAIRRYSFNISEEDFSILYVRDSNYISSDLLKAGLGT